MKQLILYSFFFFLFFQVNISNAQNKEKIFQFVVYKPIIFDTITMDYIGKEYEFTTKRIYLNESIFNEINLFAQSSSVWFKISNGKWFIRKRKKWVVFFNKNNKSKSVVNLYDRKFIASWGKKELLAGISVYSLNFLPQGFSMSHNPTYYFSDKYGIIGFKNETMLIRNDVISQLKR